MNVQAQKKILPIKNVFFLGNFSQTWVGGGTVSQIKITNSGRTKIHLLCSQISQKPWDGWVGKHIWERSPKKNVFFIPSLKINSVPCLKNLRKSILAKLIGDCYQSFAEDVVQNWFVSNVSKLSDNNL